jgi:hypothetical protein
MFVHFALEFSRIGKVLNWQEFDFDVRISRAEYGTRSGTSVHFEYGTRVQKSSVRNATPLEDPKKLRVYLAYLKIN